MPVKVRCKHCSHVVTAPDKVRGKAVKCPQCAEPIRIPTAKSKTAVKKRARVQSSVDDDNFLAGMDLRYAEDTQSRICKKCGTPARDAEEVDCSHCRHNIDTGILSLRMKDIIARGGIDPNEFWGKAWNDSLSYAWNNKNLVIRSIVYWSFFGSISVFTFYMVTWCVNRPPQVFWGSLSAFFLMAACGWWLYMGISIVKDTLSSRLKMKRLHFDIYAVIAWGVRFLVWPVAIFSPILILSMVGLGIYVGIELSKGQVYEDIYNQLMSYSDFFQSLQFIVPASIALGVVQLAWPVGIAHMSMRHTHKAFIPSELFFLFFKNFIAVVYITFLRILLSLPLFIAVAILFAFFRDTVLDYWNIVEEQTSVITSKITGAKDAKGFVYHATFFPGLIVAYYIHLLPVCALIAYSEVFFLRGIGLFAYYFGDKLELVRETYRNEPASLAARYLAFLIDFSILLIFCSIVQAIGYTAGTMVAKTGIVYFFYLFNGIAGVGWIVFPWFYHARAESSGAYHGTIGKRSVGIIVLTHDHKTLDFSQATTRFFTKSLSTLTFGIGYMMAWFDEEKKTMHDNMTKTVVVWKGDETDR